MSDKQVCFVVDNAERGRFFKRFERNGDKYRYIYLDVGTVFSVIAHSGSRIWMFWPFFWGALYFWQVRAWRHFEAKNTLDYYTVGLFVATLKYFLGYVQFFAISRCFKVDTVVVWNGSQAFTAGVLSVCKDKNIKIKFLEIGNIPGKMFVDPQGVNAKSMLFKNSHLLEEYAVDQDYLDQCVALYERHLELQKAPPQLANAKDQKIPLETITSKFKDLFKSHQNNNNIADFSGEGWHNLVPESYVFIPLQVSNDTQILLNSSVTNLDLIKMLLSETRYSKTKFVVKFHPCDQQGQVENILDILKNEERFTINQGPTFSLIRGASKVITINSTVGLEAKILGREVSFLGKTLFDSLNQVTAKIYAFYHLIDVDYFSHEDLTRKQIDDIILFDIENRVAAKQAN